MIRSGSLAFVFGLLPVIACAFQQQPAGFTISGTVVEHATGRPLGGILVIVSPTTARDRLLSVLTGSDGRFSFTDLPAGKYSLLAQRRGEREVDGYQGTEGFSTGVVAGPEMNTRNLTFPLEAPARISGAVIDEDGEAVRQASVLLFRKFISSGLAQVNQAAQIATGSSGKFHFAHLAPGTYFIAVQAQPWYAQLQQPGVAAAQNARDLDVAYPLTYYGDVTTSMAAAPITLAEGGSVTVQIDLRAVPAIHVAILGMDTSQGGGVGVTVTTEGPGGVPILINAPTMGFNNSFELTGLAPGRYTVELQAVVSGEAQVSSRQTIDLADGSTLSVRGTAPASVSGHVTFEGPDHPSNGIRVLLSDGKRGSYAQLQQDGSFSFDSNNPVSPGRYEVYINNAPGGYVKSVAAKGAPVSGDTVEIAEGASVQLSVVVGNGVRSKLDGIALRDGKPVSAAMVLLLPQDLNRSLIIRRDQSDSDGTFTLPEISPGRYTLLAIDDGSDLAYQDPAVIRPYLAEGQVIDIPAEDNAPVKVKVIARKR